MSKIYDYNYVFCYDSSLYDVHNSMCHKHILTVTHGNAYCQWDWSLLTLSSRASQFLDVSDEP